MSLPLPSAMELTAVAAVAVVLSLTGMWLTRLVASLIGHPSAPTAGRSSRPAGQTASTHPRLGYASAVAASGRQPRDRWSGARRALRAVQASLNGLIGAAWLRRTSNRQRANLFGISQQPVAAAAQRMSIETQWERAATVVGRAVASASTARAAHISAGEKLDAAQYALEKLLHELEGIISLSPSPAEVAVFARTSNVVSLRAATSVMAARAAA